MLNKITNFLTAVGVQQEDTAAASQHVLTSEPVFTAAFEPTLSTAMNRVSAPFNKYSSIINTTDSIKPQAEKPVDLNEYLFGKETTRFETLKENFLAR